MAELRDWLNRTILYIELQENELAFVDGNIRLVFQKNIFIDNIIGWQDEIQAEIKIYKFCFSRNRIEEFVITAKNWLELPIEKLGITYFSGEWEFGFNSDNHFTLTFQKYYSTPSKTDWFLVNIQIKCDVITWEETIHVDYTCLALLVEGLSLYLTKRA